MNHEPILIPVGSLTQTTLRRVIEEYITREGTDYGRVEVSVTVQIERAMKAIETGDVVIMFDPATETTTLVKADALPRS